jgi:hypothetical protein
MDLEIEKLKELNEDLKLFHEVVLLEIELITGGQINENK